MTSILKVDTIQDTAGNNIINESSDTITIGASGDTVTIPSGATIDLSSATQTGVGGTNTPAFFVYKSSTQTLSDATWTLITFDTEQIDTDNAFASNTFTVPSGQTGTYVIGAYVEYNGDASNLRDTGMEIRINGTVQARQQSYFEASYPSRQPQRIEKVVSLGAGDTVTIYGLLNVGSGTCQALGEDKGTNFYGYKIIE
jgi:hypothetical protein